MVPAGPRRWRGRSLTLTALAALLLASAAGIAHGAEPAPAKRCGACHGPIRRQWEGSAMSRSWTNPVFQAFLSDAKAALGDSIQAKCIACHAPLASVTGDIQVQSTVAQEGVTCNFCHNVSDAEASPRPASYTFDPSDPELMRGPYSDADPGAAHKFTFSPIHTKSEFCASCHYFSHPQAGVPIETTYERWKASDYAAEGDQCQDCHMPPAAGQAAPKVSKMNREKVWAHTFLGAHGPGVLDSAATMEGGVEGDSLKLTITNRRAGHAIPGGGGGMRMVALDVTFFDAAGKEMKSVPVQTFGIFYADEKGASPVPKWRAKRLVRIHEIPSGQFQVERCAVPSGAKRAEAALTYHFVNPAYVADLSRRQVDLGRHQPVVMARATVRLP